MSTAATQVLTKPLFELNWSFAPLLPQHPVRKPPKQFLKWVGNKQRFAEGICNYFPALGSDSKYIEPFIGSGALLGAMAPHNGLAGDMLQPLIELWQALQSDPQKVYDFYELQWQRYQKEPDRTYKNVLAAYNENPNGLDLLFLSRSCYGGVIRFTKQGRMSTPRGPHDPISPESFKERMLLWRQRLAHTKFVHAPYQETMGSARKGDIVYCDPPYQDSQSILYGAQAFRLSELWSTIQECKQRGALVALSIDGRKKSGTKTIDLGIPKGLFPREIYVKGGSSMLRRFQKKDDVMVGEDVHDRLLLTW